MCRLIVERGQYNNNGLTLCYEDKYFSNLYCLITKFDNMNLKVNLLLNISFRKLSIM